MGKRRTDRRHARARGHCGRVTVRPVGRQCNVCKRWVENVAAEGVYLGDPREREPFGFVCRGRCAQVFVDFAESLGFGVEASFWSGELVDQVEEWDWSGEVEGFDSMGESEDA